ncbi:GNAT family N-acetyltransferase [Thalassiella azotivora]
METSTSAPSRAVPLPPGAHGLTWRPIEEADLPAWLELEQAIEAADDPAERYELDDLREELLDGSWKDPRRDTVLALDDDGRARAFGQVTVLPGDTRVVRAFCWGGVHPQWRRRGIGRELLTWQEARGRQAIAETGKQAPGRVLVHAGEQYPDRQALLASAGFRQARWYLEMTRPLTGDGAQPVPDVALDEELRLVPFDADLGEAVRLAHNEAFAEHWGSEPRDPESWRQHTVGGRSFRADWSFVVLDGDEVAGYTLASAYRQDWAAQGYSSGWTDLLGVRPRWRGRRIAPALLAATMRALLAEGIERADLGVDSENPSGALGLYHGMGYTQTRREAAWVKDVPPPA